MKDTDYAFCVARLRANERYMLNESDISRLCECEDYDSAIAFLMDKGYIESKGSIKEIASYQNKKLWQLLTQSVPNKKEINILCLLNDFFNIKAAVKCHFTESDAEEYYVYPTSLDTHELTKNVNAHEFYKIGGAMGECAEKSYKAACLAESGQSCDIIIDCAAVSALKEYSDKNKNDLSGEICAFICDTANIKTAYRCSKAKKSRDFTDAAIGECCLLDRRLLIKACLDGEPALRDYLSKTPYSELSEAYCLSSAQYDKKCDDEIIAKIKKAKLTSFGFDPVCAYYYAKQTEIKTVRIILSGIELKLDKEKIRERVRALYV